MLPVSVVYPISVINRVWKPTWDLLIGNKRFTWYIRQIKASRKVVLYFLPKGSFFCNNNNNNNNLLHFVANQCEKEEAKQHLTLKVNLTSTTFEGGDCICIYPNMA